MKWRTPDPGEERGGWAFAFLPTECEEGVTVWLQRYWRVERYTSIRVHTGLRIWGWVWQRGYAYKALTDQAQAMASEGREARRVYKPPPRNDDDVEYRVVLPCPAGSGSTCACPGARTRARWTRASRSSG